MEVLPNLPKFQFFFLDSHLADYFTRQGLNYVLYETQLLTAGPSRVETYQMKDYSFWKAFIFLFKILRQFSHSKLVTKKWINSLE